MLYLTLIDLLNFNLIGLFEFHITLFLTTCANQLLYNLSLTKLFSACAKHNPAVKTANDACLLLEK